MISYHLVNINITCIMKYSIINYITVGLYRVIFQFIIEIYLLFTNIYNS